MIPTNKNTRVFFNHQDVPGVYEIELYYDDEYGACFELTLWDQGKNLLPELWDDDGDTVHIIELLCFPDENTEKVYCWKYMECMLLDRSIVLGADAEGYPKDVITFMVTERDFEGCEVDIHYVRETISLSENEQGKERKQEMASRMGSFLCSDNPYSSSCTSCSTDVGPGDGKPTIH